MKILFGILVGGMVGVGLLLVAGLTLWLATAYWAAHEPNWRKNWRKNKSSVGR